MLYVNSSGEFFPFKENEQPVNMFTNRASHRRDQKRILSLIFSNLTHTTCIIAWCFIVI